MIYHPLILFLLVAIFVVSSLTLYKVLSKKSNYTSFGGSKSISLLQWNIHYECFTENKDDCCSSKVVNYLQKAIPRVDFANLSMFELSGYKPPSQYGIISAYGTPTADQCGYDITTLLYNTNNWKAVGTPIHGCLIPKDRAYIIQKFQNISDSTLIVYVIGAHFSHPKQGQTYPIASIATLKKALLDNGIGSSDKIILMADTNDNFPYKPTSDSTFMNAILDQKAKNVQGAGANQTCCCNDSSQKNGPFPFKTDRIISNNMGTGGDATAVNLTDIFGSVVGQCPPSNNPSCILGEMHKPVLWTVNVN